MTDQEEPDVEGGTENPPAARDLSSDAPLSVPGLRRAQRAWEPSETDLPFPPDDAPTFVPPAGHRFSAAGVLPETAYTPAAPRRAALDDDATTFPTQAERTDTPPLAPNPYSLPPESDTHYLPETVTKRSRWVLPVIIGGVVLAVIAAVGVLFVLPSMQASSTATGGQAKTAAAAVSGYLEALARGDAEGALAFGKVRPSDTSMLTDAALSAALAKTPLTAISATQTSIAADTATVSASYKLGDTAVESDYQVVKSGSNWQLASTAAQVQLSDQSLSTVTVQLNGTKISGVSPGALFPGNYQLTTSDDRYVVSPQSFVITSPSSGGAPSQIQLGLSAKGIAAVQQAAATQLKSCLSQNSMQPSGCGFGGRIAGASIKKATWKVLSGMDTLSALKPQVVQDDARYAVATVKLSLRVSATDSDGARYTGTSTITRVQADLSKDAIDIQFG